MGPGGPGNDSFSTTHGGFIEEMHHGDLGKRLNLWNGVKPLYDSSSMPVSPLGVGFEGGGGS